MKVSAIRLLLATVACALPGTATRAADAAPAPAVEKSAEAPAAPKSYAERLEAAGIKLTHGPATVKLGSVSEYKLLAGEHFVGSDSLDKFYKLTHNGQSGKEVGVIITDFGRMLFFDYDPVGYVKDDEKDKLDADALLKSMQEGQEQDNVRRKEKGWDEMRVVGWAQKPHYDEKTHNLKWAFTLSSSADGYKETWINENIRLLGREGIMNVTLVTGNESFAAQSLIAAQNLAANFSYVVGQNYAEFKQGDKVAAYGLSALVLGGGVAVAAKMGWLAKFWKFLVFGIAALGGAIMKLFRKVTGREDPPAGPPTTTSS